MNTITPQIAPADNRTGQRHAIRLGEQPVEPTRDEVRIRGRAPEDLGAGQTGSSPPQAPDAAPASTPRPDPPAGRANGSQGVQLRLFQEDAPLNGSLLHEAQHSSPASGAELKQAVQANNRFALDLFRQVGAGTKEGFFLAPSTVSGCLAMVLAGARGEAAEGLTRTLHLKSLAEPRVHTAVAELENRTRTDDPGVSVKVSNRVFTDSGYPVNPQYRETTREVYRAEVGQTDFRGDPEGARQQINALVGQDTNGRIPELLPANSVAGDTRIVLTSAVHFEGKWETAFPEFLDREADFYVPGQSEPLRVDMMNVKHDFRYAEVNLDGREVLPDQKPDLQLVELPYQGGRFSRLLLVAGAVDGLAAVEARLDADTLRLWTGQMSELEVDVYFPKNESSSAFELSGTLSGMGASAAFGGGDLSGIGPEGLSLSQVFHQTFVKDGNQGTEFAGATGALGKLGIPPPGPEVRADHPFLTLVRDNQTGAILATQRVTRPRWSA